MKSKWNLPIFNQNAINDLATSLHISPTLACLLIHRGFHTPLEASHFLYPDRSMIHDPYLFSQMTKAIGRIRESVDNKENVMIYGDYDVDGLTGTAILYHILSRYLNHLQTYIPHRINQGYGLKSDAIHYAKKENINLIITVDCGITALKEAKLAKELGLDIIITDHHLYHEELPEAIAIIHPGLPDETYPYSHLSGAGVAYKLAQAIDHELSKSQTYLSDELLDLAAIGTLSDIVQLNGENRVIARHGLSQLSKSARPGLHVLLEKTRLINKNIESWHIGYILGPRINAAGRLGKAEKALDLLLTDSLSEADEITDILEKYNRERQLIENDVYEQAEQLVQTQIDLDSEPVIVLANPNWHMGVLGIVASKLVDEFERPVILIGLNLDYGKGSGRSVDGFHIVKALEYCSDFLIGFGGHQMACGLTIQPNNVIPFREKINEFAHQSGFQMAENLHEINLDTEVNLSQLNIDFLHSLNLLSPHGPGNPEPLFLIRNLSMEMSPKIIKDTHLKMWVNDTTAKAEAIWYGNADKVDWFLNRSKRWDFACHAQLNQYNGINTLELRVRDVRSAEK